MLNRLIYRSYWVLSDKLIVFCYSDGHPTHLQKLHLSRKCLVFIKRQWKELRLDYWVDILNPTPATFGLGDTGRGMWSHWDDEIIIPAPHWIVVKIGWHKTHIIDIRIKAIVILFSFLSDESYANLSEAKPSLKINLTLLELLLEIYFIKNGAMCLVSQSTRLRAFVNT